MLLLDAIVLGMAVHLEAEHALKEGKARLAVADHDRRVIDALEQRRIGFVPPGGVLVRRERQDLEVMAVRVLEVEGLDAARVRGSTQAASAARLRRAGTSMLAGAARTPGPCR